MINLHLSGELAAIVGQEVVELEVSSPREAILAMAYQLPDYRDKLFADNWHVFVGKGNDITVSELDMSLGNVTDIYLVPVIEGAVVGAIVIGAALAGGGVAFASGALLVGLVAAGVGLMMSGVMMLLTKPPEPASASSTDSNASFLFNGAVNTTSQGDPIPIGYGKMLCGSVVVSAALYAEDI